MENVSFLRIRQIRGKYVVKYTDACVISCCKFGKCLCLRVDLLSREYACVLVDQMKGTTMRYRGTHTKKERIRET